MVVVVTGGCGQTGGGVQGAGELWGCVGRDMWEQHAGQSSLGRGSGTRTPVMRGRGGGSHERDRGGCLSGAVRDRRGVDSWDVLTEVSTTPTDV